MWFGELTRFPKEDHLPDWARRDNKVTKGDRVDWEADSRLSCQEISSPGNITSLCYPIRRD